MYGTSVESEMFFVCMRWVTVASIRNCDKRSITDDVEDDRSSRSCKQFQSVTTSEPYMISGDKNFKKRSETGSNADEATARISSFKSSSLEK